MSNKHQLQNKNKKKKNHNKMTAIIHWTNNMKRTWKQQENKWEEMQNSTGSAVDEW